MLGDPKRIKLCTVVRLEWTEQQEKIGVMMKHNPPSIKADDCLRSQSLAEEFGKGCVSRSYVCLAAESDAGERAEGLEGMILY